MLRKVKRDDGRCVNYWGSRVGMLIALAFVALSQSACTIDILGGSKRHSLLPDQMSSRASQANKHTLGYLHKQPVRKSVKRPARKQRRLTTLELRKKILREERRRKAQYRATNLRRLGRKNHQDSTAGFPRKTVMSLIKNDRRGPVRVIKRRLPTTVMQPVANRRPLIKYRISGGRKVFNSDKLTAVHTRLPVGSYVRIRNLQTQKIAIVRINETRYLGYGKIVEVSPEVACLLGFGDLATDMVRVEALNADEGAREILAYAKWVHRQRNNGYAKCT